MSQSTSEIRTQVASLIEQAIALGPRKELRSTLVRALEIAKGDAPRELTQLHYDRLGRGARLADPVRPGLIMKSSKTGLKRWTYRTEVEGKQRELTLGHYPEMSVSEARDKWATLRVQRVSGAAPDLRGDTTLGEIVDHYGKWASENLRSWRENDQLLRKHLLPGREGITLAELDIDHLSAPITAIQAKTPQQARKLRSAISGVLTRARKDGLLPKGFSITPVMLPEVKAASPRTWVPGTKDLRAFLRATREMGEIGAALRLIALTGTRLREVVEMRWDEVEIDAEIEGLGMVARWTIPAERMKAKRPHVVILSDAAMAVLDAQRGSGSPCVFPSPTCPEEPRLANHVGKVWADKRDALGRNKQFTVHTLRKALSTWVAESGGTRDIRDRLTAHTLATGVDAHYNQAELTAPAAEWWQRWADRLAAIEGENVILMGEVRA
ncbi:tyrosine-type recombinase/integrase [Ruegeria arenilitoris]|uniref:tyrosine-type recombinase/integrase n=1 Tax=Ruegeria arenilitoris TaxID=1173585 RepID=UPI00147CA489|nr:site-specific integrase [Ruegeria arenilitoris]